jgi:Acyltransferase family
MTTTSHTAAVDVHATPKVKTRSFARSRPHVSHAGGAAASRRHSLYIFRSYRSEVLLRLRHDRARHRQFLHGDVLFLSGLFVWPGIARKGPQKYLSDHLIRLGVPFVICAFTVIPLAYYAISLRLHPEIGFSEYWWKTITVGPWPSGPVWFLWVLFAFDLVACLLYRLSPTMLDPINRLSLHGRLRPAVFFAVMLVVTAAFYIPGLIHLKLTSQLDSRTSFPDQCVDRRSSAGGPQNEEDICCLRRGRNNRWFAHCYARKRTA